MCCYGRDIQVATFVEHSLICCYDREIFEFYLRETLPNLLSWHRYSSFTFVKHFYFFVIAEIFEFYLCVKQRRGGHQNYL